MTNSDRLAVDPATFDLVRRSLDMLCDEMAITLARSAYSPLIRQALDCAAAILTPDCELLSQGRTTALHFGPMIGCTRSVIRDYGQDMVDGDVFLMNDPFDGGTHLPDVFVVRPVFIEGEVHFFAVSEAHHADIGGRVAGGSAPDSTTIYEEGLRLPPTRLRRADGEDEHLLRLLQLNVRKADQVLGDIRAQVEAVEIGAEGLTGLARRHGVQVLRRYCDELLAYTERRVRKALAEWPMGSYSFEDRIDDDSSGNGEILIRAELSVRDGRAVIDFAGSSPQVRMAINQPDTVTVGAALVPVRAALDESIPCNSGMLRALEVRVPSGSLLAATAPAPVAARAVTAYRVCDTVVGCLVQLFPERMMAAGDGGNTLVTFAGHAPDDGREVIWSDIHIGAWGARSDRDGIDGICSPAISIANTPVESIEREMPMRILRYGFVTDTGGAGKWRGGLGAVREYQSGLTGSVLSIRSDRVLTAPYGVDGGGPGATTVNLVRKGTSPCELPSKCVVQLDDGDVYVSQLAGGGGWGLATERDPQRVLRDVLDEKVSVTAAREVYGVVVAADGVSVDASATSTLRAAMAVRGSCSHRPST